MGCGSAKPENEKKDLKVDEPLNEQANKPEENEDKKSSEENEEVFCIII